MTPEEVHTSLQTRADELRRTLHDRWGEVPHRERDPIAVEAHSFPADPDDLFPWAAVCFVADDGRVLLVEDAGHDSAWEPPGGKGERDGRTVDDRSAESGEAGERPFETAERETREETGIECEVADLLFTETLRFDYGESVLAPVLQAGFVARRTGGEARAREANIESVDWFRFDDLPEGTQFRDDLRSLSPSR